MIGVLADPKGLEMAWHTWVFSGIGTSIASLLRRGDKQATGRQKVGDKSIGYQTGKNNNIAGGSILISNNQQRWTIPLTLVAVLVVSIFGRITYISITGSPHTGTSKEPSQLDDASNDDGSEESIPDLSSPVETEPPFVPPEEPNTTEGAAQTTANSPMNPLGPAVDSSPIYTATSTTTETTTTFKTTTTGSPLATLEGRLVQLTDSAAIGWVHLGEILYVRSPNIMICLQVRRDVGDLAFVSQPVWESHLSATREAWCPYNLPGDQDINFVKSQGRSEVWAVYDNGTRRYMPRACHDVDASGFPNIDGSPWKIYEVPPSEHIGHLELDPANVDRNFCEAIASR